MVDCKPVSTPVDTQAKVSTESEPDPTHFKSLIGALQYLTFTHLDIAYAVQQVWLHMHVPREPHLTAMKHIISYLWGTLKFGLIVRCFAYSELMVYTDADYASCSYTCRSTSGYVVFLRTNLIS
jgi:hypothetical protein